jgi:hypothetical protein
LHEELHTRQPNELADRARQVRASQVRAVQVRT